MGAVDSFDTIGRAKWLERNWSIMRVALGFALSLTIIGLLVNSVYRLGTRAAGDAPGIMAYADSYRERPSADQSAPGQYEQLSAYSLVGGGSGAADSMSANVRAAPPPQPLAGIPARSVVDIESAVSYRLREELVRLRQIPTKPDLVGAIETRPPSPPDRRGVLIAAAARQPAPTPIPEPAAAGSSLTEQPQDAAVASAGLLAMNGGVPMDANAGAAAQLQPPAPETAFQVLAGGAQPPRPPRLRPNRPNRPIQIAAATPVPTAPVGAQTAIPAAAPAPAVSRFEIQLGALPSEQQVRSRWGHFQQRYPRILTGLGFRVMPVSTGGGSLYRLRVGPFNDRNRADQICRALKAQGAECFVSVNN